MNSLNLEKKIKVNPLFKEFNIIIIIKEIWFEIDFNENI